MPCGGCEGASALAEYSGSSKVHSTHVHVLLLAGLVQQVLTVP